MATSDESKSTEQGSDSQEVEREAQGIRAAFSRAAAVAVGEAVAVAEVASPPPAKGAAASVVDAVTSAIVAMSDLKLDPESIAASAEQSVESAIATSSRTDADIAKLLGPCAD